MTASEIINLIPPKLFAFLSVETQVDYQVKKLDGEIIFKLILFSMLNSNKLSLRVMESFWASAQFKQFPQTEDLKSKYNSIRDRLCSINSSYFEQLHEEIFKIYNRELEEETSLSKCDSTYVSIAANLISIGMKNGKESDDKTHIKYSVYLKGSLPSSVKVFTEQSFVSEELALSELIEQTECITEDIVVFDRGLQSVFRLALFLYHRCRRLPVRSPISW